MICRLIALFYTGTFFYLIFLKMNKSNDDDKSEDHYSNISSADCLMLKEEFRNAMDMQRSGFAKIWNDQPLKGSIVWHTMEKKFNDIWHPIKLLMNIQRFIADGEETKYFVTFSNKLQRPYSCNIVTLGVGQTVRAETELKQNYPECHFLGIDPASNINAKLYADMGEDFIEMAIGGETLSRGQLYKWGQDVSQKQPVGIVDFIQNKLKGRLIDMMMMDVEGAEFDILKKMNEQPSVFTSTICQLNIELHHPSMVVGVTNATVDTFSADLDQFLRNGNYAMINVDSHLLTNGIVFLRLFLVNIVEEKCYKKFLC